MRTFRRAQQVDAGGDDRLAGTQAGQDRQLAAARLSHLHRPWPDGHRAPVDDPGLRLVVALSVLALRDRGEGHEDAACRALVLDAQFGGLAHPQRLAGGDDGEAGSERAGRGIGGAGDAAQLHRVLARGIAPQRDAEPLRALHGPSPPSDSETATSGREGSANVRTACPRPRPVPPRPRLA
jgi:hypothetical protein